MRRTALRIGLFSVLAATATMGLSGAAQASPVVIYYDLLDSSANPEHPESIISSGPLAASFLTPGYVGGIQSLTLDVGCYNGSATCGYSGLKYDPSLSFGGSNGQGSVATGTGASAGSNQVTLATITQGTIHVGSFVGGGGLMGIAAPSGPNTGIYVTAVNGNVITLSQPLTATQAADLNLGKTLVFSQQLGSFTASLDVNNPVGGTSIPGSAPTTTNIPGTTLASFAVYDAALYDTTGEVDLSFTQPFDGLELSASTVYWIDLTNNSTGDSVGSIAGWAFLADTGQPTNVGLTDEYRYVKNYTCSPGTTPCGMIDGGPNDVVKQGAYGMEITYVPEPGTLGLLGSAMLGLGLIGFRRRRKDTPNLPA